MILTKPKIISTESDDRLPFDKRISPSPGQISSGWGWLERPGGRTELRSSNEVILSSNDGKQTRGLCGCDLWAIMTDALVVSVNRMLE
ncbi:hypothetical protein G6F46_011106 [Rhizopus delemar]|uniref:Uncharacterized protein n=2 Tax=Rhizopus TaxID=4842 RepID=A0A9P6YU23_9FUNG|nr:hypothetical protein G6F55_010468 [Rhizopus delemar]KAG1536066.1 hypothetical protein G6F51_011175 [Rhizopus arrhizus]KAG1490472.1 hypothetical protein G6F54_010697 [Rhizopus delemar]KAG1502190.1 hypothetical protein G6F53_010914 [Rhizopus delemar]KAG1519206.1 hypothetical protein G6F52_008844 [Rhizopus delemar]